MQVLRRVLPRSILALLFIGIGPAPLLLGQTASLVEDIQTGSDTESLFPFDVGTFGENALFQVFEFPFDGSQMWVSDGTGSGTRPIWDIGGNRARFLGTIDRVMLWSSGRSLWRSDGTQEGTFVLNGPGSLLLGLGADPSGPVLTLAGGVFYFIGCTDDLGCEIWRTNGTREGTRIVQDLTPGRDDSPIQEIGAAGDHVFVLLAGGLRVVEENGTRLLLTFQGRNSDLWGAARNRLFLRVGNAVWATDGTTAGTRRLMESSVPDSSWPMTAAPGGLYFMASASGRVWEIWKSDGTPGGTRRISELPGHVGVSPLYSLRSAAEIGDSLLFTAYGDSFTWRLWRLSIQSGSVVPVGDAVVRSELFQVGGRMLFALRAEEGCDVASVDAKGRITLLVKGLSCTSFDPINFVNFVRSGGYLYFGGTTSSALQVWRSDGTTAGTDLLLSVPGSGTFRGIAVSTSGRRVFVTADEGLWLWEQSSGARQLMGPGPRTASADLSDFIPIGTRLFFSLCTSELNLWMSTGTAAGTEPLTSFSGEFCHAGGLAPVAAGTSLFFLDPTHHELWKADVAGNTPVLLIRDLGQISSLVAHQGRAWFVVRAGAHSEIWTSDGTPSGTDAVAPLPGDMQIMAPLISAGELLYFTAGSSGSGGSNLVEVWRSDGTAAGTIRLADTNGYFARDFVRLGPFVYFLSDGLWRTDGTPAGTVALSGAEVDLPFGLVEHAGSLYLFGRRSPADPRLTLWRTNGAPEDTIPVATFPLELYSSEIRPTLVSFHGKLFFAVDDGNHGTELWATDGTSAGTALVRDLSPGPASSSPDNLIVAGDVLYFSAHDAAHGRELWRTDGTAAGTRRVQDIAPESLSSSPEHLTIAGDHLYFAADDGLTGRELWKLPLQGPVCQPSSTRLCLNGGRFQVEVVWRDFQGRMGRGMASSLTGDTGYFWFFDPANAEVVLKVLDGRGLNDHHWVFYGALSSVEYAITVTDTQTGLARRYLNPSGQLASVGDTHGFGPLGAHSATPEPLVALPSPPALVSGRTEPAAATGNCQPGPQRLCLNGDRFAIEASWKDFEGNTGRGTAVSLTGDTGWFWFFDSSNVEVMIKVLDGTPLNGKFWVFYGALSNVEYTLKVTDTQTGAVREYKNPSGRFASVADTGAF